MNIIVGAEPRLFTITSDTTVYHGEYPFLALRKFCKEQRIKFLPVALALFDGIPSAGRAFWVFCNNERKKMLDGKPGYTLSDERKLRLAKIGIACEVFIDLNTMIKKTAVFISDNNFFYENADKRKAKPQTTE